MPNASVSELLVRTLASRSPELRKLLRKHGARLFPSSLGVTGGILFGVALGWLTAPTAGSELRKALLEKARQLGLVDQGFPRSASRITRRSRLRRAVELGHPAG